MPSLARPVRLVAAISVVAVAAAAAAAVLAVRPGDTVAVRARAAGPAAAIANLQRGPWFDMRVLKAHPEFTPVPASGPSPPLDTRAGILVDLDSGTVLWQKDSHRHLAPASTVKLMTALVSLVNFSPTRPVLITASALGQQWDETRMGLTAGQQLTVEELLSGMLLVSGNDAASALAVDTVGIERFIAAMNAQARALGMHDSHFANAVGLDDPEEYSSAYDLALLGSVAVQRYPLLARIVASRNITLTAGPGHPEYDLNSINLLLSMYPAAVGIKPGWTGDAGYCLAAMAVRDGHHLLSVLLNAPYSYSQSRRLLDWGFVRDGLTSTLPTPTPSPSPSATGPAPHG